jgi:hypothetical protein
MLKRPDERGGGGWPDEEHEQTVTKNPRISVGTMVSGMAILALEVAAEAISTFAARRVTR